MVYKINESLGAIRSTIIDMGSALKKSFNSNQSSVELGAKNEHEQIENPKPRLLIDRELLNIKRSVDYALINKDLDFLFYPEEFSRNNMSKERILKMFSDWFMPYFLDPSASKFNMYRFHVEDFNFPTFSEKQMRTKFDKYQRIFTEFDFSNPDAFDPTLHLFFYRCFDYIDSLYKDFQQQILDQRFNNVSLREDRTLLYLNKRQDDSIEFKIFGGSFEYNPSIKVFYEFEGKSSESSIYTQVKFDDSNSVSNNYNDFLSYLDHYCTFESMPTSFADFLLELKYAAFAEFAKPFILEMFIFLSKKGLPDIPKIKYDDIDDYMLLGPYNRFFLYLESKFK